VAPSGHLPPVWLLVLAISPIEYTIVKLARGATGTVLSETAV
jgi:hypothetical protein